ncbi:thiamine phosphate synthase [Granulicella paludicola]|uniref:thiamine phosphate synthase n=1 Tax=Granulicella paludicola TaxID=474951 RepID=UPI0021DFE4E9|nr:thiamine phosphate synthase [Granulicella paludicola]
MLRYAIVDGSYLIGDAGRLAADGVDYIQLRAKSLSAGAVLDLARCILHDIAEIPTAPTRLLINSRADIALATPAHGVHLTSAPDELTPTEIRHLYAAAPYSLFPTPCISLSCHSLADIARARTLAPDLILFGPIFEKRVSGELVQPGIGLKALAAAVHAAGDIPVLALGGITHENTPACLAAGAAGIAAIRLFA